MSGVTVATHNFGGGKGKLRNLAVLAEHAQVIGCQEGSDQERTIVAFVANHPGWEGYYPKARTGQAATPLLVDTSATGPVRFSSHLAVPSVWVGPKGAGSRTDSKPKYLNVAHLGDDVHVVNTHFLPSSTRSKKYLGLREWLARRSHYRCHVAAVVDLVSNLAGTVILTADFNAKPGYSLLAPIRNLGFTGWTRQPTHGRRAIDHVLIRNRGGWRLESTRVLDKGDGITSDHRAVLNHFTKEKP